MRIGRIAVAGALAGAAWSASPPASVVAVLPNGASFTLEVAADAGTRQRGYMYREAVGVGEGMIFVFDEDAPHSMWMKNCKVGLDMVWLDAAHRVVDILADRRPCPESGECPSIVPAAPGRYVVEFAAGTAARESLHVGDTIVILSPPSAR